ncbi:MAG TPA: hypothetical protein VH370_14115 [Humisphaera sp.]|nr:hypothetical protein [Humisphaera sp.]
MRQISGVYFLAALSAALVGHCASRLHAADQRPMVEQTGYGLQIGTETDIVHSLDSGSVVGQVVVEKVSGPDAWPHKHIGAVVVEDVHAHIRPDQFTKFLSESLGGHSRSDGAMYLVNAMGQVAQQRTLNHMMLNELTIPALSGASKDAVFLQIGLSVESSNLIKGGSFNGAKAGTRTKTAMANSFALTIPGLPTNRVQSIEPVTMRHKTTTNAVGELRDYEKQPTTWELSNIVFYVAANDAQAFLDWHEDFVMKGNNSNDKEKTLTLELKAPDLTTTLLTFNASGVGIVSAKYTTPSAAGSDAIMRLRVEVYAEKMTLDPGKTSATAQPTNNTDTKPDARGTMRRGLDTPQRIRGR